MDQPDAPPQLSGRQRTWLRAQAHPLRPVLRIGNAGITDAVVAEVARALLSRELIKVRLDSPEDKKGTAKELSERTFSALCGVLGHTVILYRPNPEKAERGGSRIVPPPDKPAPAG